MPSVCRAASFVLSVLTLTAPSSVAPVSGASPLVAADATMEVGITARSLQPGELMLVTVAAADMAADLRVHVFDQTTAAVPIGTGRWQAIVGIDLDQPPGSYTLVVAGTLNGQPASRERALVVEPKSFRTRTLRVAPRFVNPPPETERRIAAESALVAAAYAGSASERLWTGPFIRPVPQPANSSFGTRSVFNGERRAPHAGTDFLSGAGTPVKAPNAGRIVLGRNLYFSGNTVIIDHGLGLFSMLAHLSRIDVREGDRVATGAVVGLVGATGRVTGPHLHWAMRAGAARVDALSAVAVLGASKR